MAKETLGTLLRKTAYAATSKVESGYNEARRQIKTRTGPIGTAYDNIERTAVQTRDLGQRLYKEASVKASKTRDYLGNKFYTNGEFDYDKLDAVLENAPDAIRDLGQKAYSTLEKLAKQGAQAIKEDFRNFVPSEEELKGKYAGIGSSYNGVLFREHYDACLEYSNEAGKKISSRSSYRNPILADIKASASSSKSELLSFYEAKKQTASIKGKYTAAEKYL